MANVREIEKQARAALAPLRLPKSLKGLETAKARWELQLRISLTAANAGCELYPDDDAYVETVAAEAQVEVCLENIRAITDRLQFLEAVEPAGVPVAKHYKNPRPWRGMTDLPAVALSSLNQR